MAVVPLDELQVAESVDNYLQSVSFRRPPAAVPQRPWVTLSWAQTSDGSIAQRSGAAAAISSSESLCITHTLRARHSAILIGINTVLSDNPRLTTRLVNGASPRPVVLDSRLRCPPSARIFSEARRDHRPGPVVVTSENAIRRFPATVTSITKAGGVVVAAGSEAQIGIDLSDSLSVLYALGLESVMVEGGGLVLRSFLSTVPVDAMAVTIAPHALDGYRPFPWDLVERCRERLVARRFRVGRDDLLLSVLPRKDE
ncbi:MAG: RibD family protein [Alkalispirochaeta sp.]